MITKGSYIKVVNGELTGQILLVKDITSSGDFLNCDDTLRDRHVVNINDACIATKEESDIFDDVYTKGGFTQNM